MNTSISDSISFDSAFKETEQLPSNFIVKFEELMSNGKESVKVSIDGVQIGDVINDNSYENDYYRYHDIFHYSFATFLGWSPCTRAMLGRKRKSISLIDEFEDGARATITEEAISLIIFNEAKRKKYFERGKVSNTLLKIIKEMTEPFEVRTRTEMEWKTAILKGYELFRELIDNRGGQIKFIKDKQEAFFI